jgi:hypothetical protein
VITLPHSGKALYDIAKITGSFEYFAVKNVTFEWSNLFSRQYGRGVYKEMGSFIVKLTPLLP